MSDDSHLDSKYFIDGKIFNCPFCNRRHVSYSIHSPSTFNWTDEKLCWCYRAQCHSCGKVSMHLSFEQIPTEHVFSGGTTAPRRFEVNESYDLDSKFFYSVPTSFFVLDERVPRILRELMTEAEGCLKSNFLTGASACARKLVYELAVLENADGENYDERLKSLKVRRPDVEPEYFDTLLTVQQVTSAKVHETSYDGWQSRHLQAILRTLSEVLTAMYVLPKVRAERREAVLRLKQELSGKKAK